jgi:monoamine oxidase
MVRSTASWSWDNHPYAGGAFAWFSPGQHTTLYRHIVAPEGRVFFAGEHASLTHTWMQGALESGLRATREMLEAAQRA